MSTIETIGFALQTATWRDLAWMCVGIFWGMTVTLSIQGIHRSNALKRKGA